MSEIFLKVLNMSISATYLVLAVLLLRLVLKKAPKWISVLLWGIVAVRLMCPFSVESILSLIPSGETVSPEIMMDWTPEIQTGISSLDSVVNPVISETFAPNPITSANPLQILIPVAAVFWVAGIGIMLLYAAISYFLLQRKVVTAVRLQDRIYQSEYVASPFVLGIIRPKIYLPFTVDRQDMDHVIAHEMSHIRRKDHLWKPLGYLLLALHWFNPFVWLGYIFLCRDIELACDEKVIRKLDSDEKANYTQALVACSVGRLRIAACPLAFGEVGVKARVRSVMHYKKPAFWMIVAGIVISVAVAVCFLTNPKTKSYGETDREKLSDVQFALKGQYPNYFGLEATNGLDVYVWQMAGNSYSFGLVPHSGTDRGYLFDGWMDLTGIRAEEMQEILKTYPVEERDIHIILWQHPLSSYLPEYCIVTEGENQEQKIAEYTEKIRQMLFNVPS